VRYGGANDVVKHFSTKNHWESIKATASSSTLARFGIGNSEEALRSTQKEEEKKMQVLHAGALFVAEHNPSFRTGDHFSKLAKSMFPDSAIAKQFHCSHTKTSVLTQFGNGKFSLDIVI